MSEREAMTLNVVEYHNEQARGASFEWHARCATHVENQEQIIKALADALESAREALRMTGDGLLAGNAIALRDCDAALRLAGRL